MRACSILKFKIFSNMQFHILLSKSELFTELNVYARKLMESKISYLLYSIPFQAIDFCCCTYLPRPLTHDQFFCFPHKLFYYFELLNIRKFSRRKPLAALVYVVLFVKILTLNYFSIFYLKRVVNLYVGKYFDYL